MTVYALSTDIENISIGPAHVYFKGRHVGLTFGGVNVSVTQSTYDLKADTYGETPVKVLDAGLAIQVTANLTEATIENLKMLFSSGVEVGSDLTFGKPVGGAIQTGELVLEPTDGTSIFQIYKAAANIGGAIDIGFTTDNQRVYACVFSGLIDTTRPEGDQLFRIGGYSSPT